MAGSNKVFIKGNLGQDPELRHSASGNPVCQFSVATNEKWTSREGGRQEHTEWHRVIAFGRQAEVASEYLSKGSQLMVWGKLRARKFQDRDGNDRSVVEIHAEELEFLGGRRAEGGGAPQSQQNRRPPQRQPAQQQSRQPDPAPADGGDDFFDEDVPF